MNMNQESINITVADLRQNYTRDGLTETDADPNPFKQFQRWFEQAIAAEVPEANAMTIATTTLEGQPSARIVLLKEFNEQGFVFFTNYDSNKGQQLTENPLAALVFWWPQLERQVRIEGQVKKVSDLESDQYFQSRPWESQLGAWVSNQSQPIASRDVLDQQFRQLQQKYQDQPVPRPPHWGGFRLIPSLIEFWQGRPSRLHDRLCYQYQEDGTWLRSRLAP
jgi:pyridoxamine 5'-phosphate oxidase